MFFIHFHYTYVKDDSAPNKIMWIIFKGFELHQSPEDITAQIAKSNDCYRELREQGNEQTEE